MNRRIFIDMDGTLARWKEVSKTDELYEQGYYYNLCKPYSGRNQDPQTNRRHC